MTNDCLMQFEKSLNWKQIAYNARARVCVVQWAACAEGIVYGNGTSSCVSAYYCEREKLLDNVPCSNKKANKRQTNKIEQKNRTQKNLWKELPVWAQTLTFMWRLASERTQSALNSFSPFVICTALWSSRAWVGHLFETPIFAFFFPPSLPAITPPEEEHSIIFIAHQAGA